MDKKLYNTWMTITALVVVVGNLFNVIRMQQNRKNQEG